MRFHPVFYRAQSMLGLGDDIRQQQHTQLTITHALMVAVRLTQLLINPLGNLHLLEPLYDDWNIINPLRTDFHPLAGHTLKSQKLLKEPTS